MRGLILITVVFLKLPLFSFLKSQVIGGGLEFKGRGAVGRCSFIFSVHIRSLRILFINGFWLSGSVVGLELLHLASFHMRLVLLVQRPPGRKVRQKALT